MVSRMINQFMEMVRIDSESGDEKDFLNYVEEEVRKLGGDVERDAYGNLVARFEARGCADRDPVLLSCHGDTVKPGRGIEPVIVDEVIRSKGDTILGADDKAGIAEVFEALRIAPIHPKVEFAVSREEEVGLKGVKNMDFSLISAKRGFLMDNDTLETIVVGGPSYFALDVHITGKSAHAGMEPEKGISAILAAAKAISALRLGRLDEETTANVGIIEGGLIRNGVPDKAMFLAECRSSSHDKAVKLAAEMEGIIRKEVELVGAKVAIKTDNFCKAVNIPEDSWTVNIAKQALKTVDINAACVKITGYTDASIYNNQGIEMAVIGIGAQNEHSTDECIAIRDMENAKNVLVEILRLSADRA